MGGRAVAPLDSCWTAVANPAVRPYPFSSADGNALEIVLGANDFDGDTAERYGYVNRALPDAELDGFVDALARRIASFDRRAIAAAKNLVNQVSLPSADRLLAAITPFFSDRVDVA